MTENPFIDVAPLFTDALAREGFTAFEEPGEKHGAWQWTFIWRENNERRAIIMDLVDERQSGSSPPSLRFTVSIAIKGRDDILRANTIEWIPADALDLAVATARAVRELRINPAVGTTFASGPRIPIREVAAPARSAHGPKLTPSRTTRRKSAADEDDTGA